MFVWLIRNCTGADKIGEGKAAEGELDADGNERAAHEEEGADWEESEAEGEGDDEGAAVAKFAKPRSSRKIWQLEDDMQLLMLYAQAVEISLSGDPSLADRVGFQPGDSSTGGDAGASKLERSGIVLLKGRVDWKIVAEVVGLKCQQCQRRVKSLSADLPRLRVLYRMTSRTAVEGMIATRASLRFGRGVGLTIYV